MLNETAGSLAHERLQWLAMVVEGFNQLYLAMLGSKARTQLHPILVEGSEAAVNHKELKLTLCTVLTSSPSYPCSSTAQYPAICY